MSGRIYNTGVVAGWSGAMVAIAYAGNTSGLVRFGYVLAASVIAGFLAGRWWILWLPPATGAIVTGISIAESDIDLSPVGIALLYALAAAVACACMALGVALRRPTKGGPPTNAPGTPGTPRSPSPPSAPPPPPPPRAP